MDLQLDGKRALVTGSSDGIGEAIAKMLAQEGVLVVVHGRSREKADRVAQEITESGGKAFVTTGDLAKAEDAEQVINKALSALGGVDILVNNAGSYPVRGWLDAKPEQWTELYEINVVSMVRMIQLLVPQMKELGWGRIVQIASGAAQMPGSVPPDYAATKAANVNMTVGLAQELSKTGITVNTVSPGPIVTAGLQQMWTEIGESRGWGSDWSEIEKHMLEEVMQIPSDRLGQVEDIAYAVTSLCSPLASYVNGANLRVDGALTPTIN